MFLNVIFVFEINLLLRCNEGKALKKKTKDFVHEVSYF